MNATALPPEREDEIEQYVEKLTDSLPPYLFNAVETALEDGDNVSVYGCVDDARVVVNMYDSEMLDADVNVEFDRYKNTGVCDVTVEFEP